MTSTLYVSYPYKRHHGNKNQTINYISELVLSDNIDPTIEPCQHEHVTACKTILDSYKINKRIVEVRVFSKKINSVPRYISNDKWYIHQQIQNSIFPHHLIASGSNQNTNLQKNKKSLEDDAAALKQLIDDFKASGQSEGVSKYEEKAISLKKEIDTLTALEHEYKQYEIEFSIYKYIPTQFLRVIRGHSGIFKLVLSLGLYEILDHVVDNEQQIIDFAVNGFVEPPNGQVSQDKLIQKLDALFNYEFPETQSNWHVIFDFKFYPPCIQTISFFSHTQQYKQYQQLNDFYLCQIHLSAYESQELFRHVTIDNNPEGGGVPINIQKDSESIKLEFKKVREIASKKQRDQQDGKKPYDAVQQIKNKLSEIVRLLSVDESEKEKIELALLNQVKTYPPFITDITLNGQEQDIHADRLFEQYVNTEIMSNINRRVEKTCEERGQCICLEVKQRIGNQICSDKFIFTSDNYSGIMEPFRSSEMMIFGTLADIKKAHRIMKLKATEFSEVLKIAFIRFSDMKDGQLTMKLNVLLYAATSLLAHLDNSICGKRTCQLFMDVKDEFMKQQKIANNQVQQDILQKYIQCFNQYIATKYPEYRCVRGIIRKHKEYDSFFNMFHLGQGKKLVGRQMKQKKENDVSLKI